MREAAEKDLEDHLALWIATGNDADDFADHFAEADALRDPEGNTAAPDLDPGDFAGVPAVDMGGGPGDFLYQPSSLPGSPAAEAEGEAWQTYKRIHGIT